MLILNITGRCLRGTTLQTRQISDEDKLGLLVPGGGGDMVMFRGQGGGTILSVSRELLASFQLLFFQELSDLWG